ncbi:hypothetical protein BX264_7136 [Streptomyces sp. 2333.5]|nr:hypothetical protein BX264_0010 [Streptomyces sp. 2333.5]PJJ06594.1 hypothetical protein BX264_7136 [Streptomyces sp. 2333.5]SEB58432.1 hypothetical protein SAMN05428943_0010 [Streptomyces sp. 2314.4]SEC39063.1 hypothetical protein SAMN05428942_0010 [Streptomyces sp. 2112.2]SEF11438.1 hypothetical protein SAMN05428942_7237 [Streptomyces sp. 2112.2]
MGGTALEAGNLADTGMNDTSAAAAQVDQTVTTNNGTLIGIQNNHEIQRLRGIPLTDDWIRRRLGGYVGDDDTAKALGAILDIHRVGVIHAGAGTGRYTTALHTLKRLGVQTIRQVRRMPDEKIELEGLLDEDTGWILDLRHETQLLPTTTGLHLTEVADHLIKTRSFVIAVVHTDIWTNVAGEAPGLAHHLSPADALAVARAHLSDQPLSEGELSQWLRDVRITSHLKNATPAQAVDWADKIAAAVVLDRTTTEHKSFDELVDFVVQSAQNWRRKLLEWHNAETDSGHRTYMLAAAVLDGAPAQSVYDAHITLGTALGDTPLPTKGQQGPGIIALTDSINADLGLDDRIRFLRPGYAEAVVDYFWADRPHHVEAFTRWTAEQAELLPSELGIPLADRVSQWTTRYTLTKQSLTVLRATATNWAASKHLKGHASDLLVAAALDPVAGKLARDRYLDWAKAPDEPTTDKKRPTPPALKRALAEAMAQLAPAYAEVALRRLADLAAHTDDPQVTEAVGDALMTLWEQDGFQQRIRDRLTTWFGGDRNQAAAARRAFLHLAERTGPDGIPALLTSHPITPDSWTLTGWRQSLDDTKSRQAQDAVSTWLDAALAHPTLRTTVIATFTEAVFRSDTDHTYLPQRFIVLNHAANGWEPAHAGQAPTERTRLRDELLIAIREADPAAPTRSHDAPTTP